MTNPDLFSRALAGIPGIAPVDTRLEAAPTDPAFSVLEGDVPDTLPPGNLLLINPEGPLVPATGDLPALGPLTTQVDHPLLAGIDLRALLVDRAKQINTPIWLEPLAGTDEGPLLLAGELEGRRIVVLTFDIADSNLAKLAAFPLFMANLTDWLSPLAGAQALQPGESVALSPGATVTAPDKTSLRVGSTGLYARTEQAGIYTVSQNSQAQNGTSGANSAAGTNTFAVNMTDIKESNLLPRAHPEFQNQVEAPGAKANPVNHEYWSSLAAVALLLVGAEWLFYCIRRGRS